MAGPLDGVTIIEIAGIGPGPFAGMMLADMGAQVITVERPGGNPMAQLGHGVMLRSRRQVAINLRDPSGVAALLRLVEQVDGLFEGMRPGVAERLGFGPEVCLERNPRLVFGRMTGWGQDGPMAPLAGHDLNYIALTGALHAIGRAGEKPAVPLNLIGDFGGGGMLLAYGMVCGLLHAARTGQGQVVDAAMIDGASALMAMFFHMRAQGAFTLERGTNLLDSGAPYYDVYETADGRYISLGSLEPQFYAQFVDLLGFADDPDFDPATQIDVTRWTANKAKVAARVREKTRDEWDEILGGSDVCYAPVLDLDEAPSHPHNVARGAHVEVDGLVQPAPAPRFSASSPSTPTPQARAGAHSREVLTSFGFSADEVERLVADGVVAQA